MLRTLFTIVSILLCSFIFPTDSCKTIDERNKAKKMVINHDDSSNLVNFHGPTAKIMSWLLGALIVLYVLSELKKFMTKRRSGRRASMTPTPHLPPTHPPTHPVPSAMHQLTPTQLQTFSPPPYMLPQVAHPTHPSSHVATLSHVAPIQVSAPPLLSKLPNLSQKEE